MENKNIDKLPKPKKILNISLYSFDQLNKEAQQRVVDEYRDVNVESNDWWESNIENFLDRLQKKLKLNTIKSTDITFSLDRDYHFGIISTAVANLIELKLKGKCSIRLLPSKVGYWHAEFPVMRYNKTEEDALIIDCQNEKIINMYKEKAGNVLNIIVEECKRTLKEIETDYSYLIGDESIIDTIKTNEWLFTIDGKLM